MMPEDILNQLSSLNLKQIQVISRNLRIPYSGKAKTQLIDELMQSDHDRLRRVLGPLHYYPEQNELVIALIDSWDWKRRAAMFLTTFGTIWLLLEPISAFTTGARILSLLGWWGYSLLIILSLISIPVCETRHRKRQTRSYKFTAFRLIFPKSGRQILVRAPVDMQIESFLREFVEKVRRVLPVECAAMHLYAHNLMIETPMGFKPLDSNMTLGEAGITDGTVCRLRGYIRIEYSSPLLDIEYSWQPVRLEVARAGGLVILDEEDSMTYEEAKAKGLLRESAIARVERFLHKHTGKVFVCFCPENEIAEVQDLAIQGEVP